MKFITFSRVLVRKRTFGLVSLFNGISTFVGYLMPKLSRQNSCGTIQLGGQGNSILFQRSLSESKRLVWFGLVSFFNGISTFVGYSMLKPFL